MTVAAKAPLTVVMPAYNEEDGIETAVREVGRWALDAVAGSELLVVDDGSRDRTGGILDGLTAGEPRLRVIHQPNAGHGGALQRGLEEARGEYVLIIDSDRQVPIEAFGPLWEAARGRDGAFGVRVDRRDPLHRLVLSSIVRVALRLIFGVRLRDANAPFKIIRRAVWISARELVPPGTLAPSIFLAIFARASGLDVVELDVPHRKRTTGVVSIRRLKLVRFCARAFGQLLAFRRRIARWKGPTRS